MFKNSEHESVEFVIGVEQAEEVARVSVGSKREEIAEGGREKGGELGLGKKFEQRRLVVVNDGGGGLHGGVTGAPAALRLITT